MHTAHSSNRKSKSNSSRSRVIEGVSNEEWDSFLQKECPPPKRLNTMTPEILKFTHYAKSKGYSYSQIAVVAGKKFGVHMTPNAYGEAVRRAACRTEQQEDK